MDAYDLLFEAEYNKARQSMEKLTDFAKKFYEVVILTDEHIELLNDCRHL